MIASKMIQIRPYFRMFRRTVTYSVAIGTPSLTAYIWLNYYLEFGRFPTRFLPESLFTNLLFAFFIFLLLGGLVGILIAIMTAIFHRRLVDPVRYRLMIGLVPLLPSILCFLLSYRNINDVFWGSFLSPYEASAPVIGRWLLATTIAVAICQFVANIYDLEVLARKSDRRAPMWRAMPLIKMVVRITAVCAVVPVAELYLHILVFYDGSVIISNHAKFFRIALATGVGTGFILGSGMALTTMLFFNEIRQPNTFRATMVAYALIAVIMTEGWLLARLPRVLDESRPLAMLSWSLELLVVVVPLLVCHFAAGRYLRAVTSGKTKTVVKTNASALSSATPAGDPAPRAPARN